MGHYGATAPSRMKVRTISCFPQSTGPIGSSKECVEALFWLNMRVSSTEDQMVEDFMRKMKVRHDYYILVYLSYLTNLFVLH